MRTILLLLLFSLFTEANAQPTFVKDTSIKVQVNAKQLKNPWAGGFNCPQFSTIDLNNDGIQDLFLFDRDGNVVKTFINKGTPNKVDYVYAPQYESAFPPLQKFVLLADYNCDGKADIYTFSASNGIMLYRNDGTPGNLKFTLVSSLLTSLHNGNALQGIFVSPAGIPAIADIDNDGDLDILVVDITGNHVEYHKNMSKEKNYGCDSLVFEYQKECWGHFSTSPTNNDATISDVNCTPSARIGTFNHRTTHGGANLALLAFNPYGKSVKDLLVGDIGLDNLLYLSNTGSIVDAQMTSKTDSFPASDIHVNLSYFPAAFELDVDNDGIKDLLVSPNQTGGENAQSAWFYKNIGTATNAHYVLQTKSFLQEDMIDVGTGAAPAFFDYDGDGLLDLVIGNYGYVGKNSYLSGITLFKNTGTSTVPAFSLVTTDYAGISKLSLSNIAPTFGDIDGDGDVDMVIGESYGGIYFCENTAGAGKPANFVLPGSTPSFSIQGGNSVPQLVDVDKDGLLDLLIGSQYGNIVYYRNTGSKNSASFSLVTKNLGNVDTRQGNTTGYSSPLLLPCNKADLFFCGTESGNLYLYSNIDNNLAGSFTFDDNQFEHILTGTQSIIAAADINGDSKPDLLVGNNLGGVALYIQVGACNDSVKVVIGISEVKGTAGISLQPNPVKDVINITLPDIATAGTLQVYNLLGRQVYSSTIVANTSLQINVQDWPKGMYILKYATAKERFMLKFIKD